MSEDKVWNENEAEERMYPDYIKEAQMAYAAEGNPALGRLLAKKQGEYTVEDYYVLPEDCRVELIDGVIYNMVAPTNLHQMIVFRVAMAIDAWIERRKGKCIVMIAPADVQLNRDDKTMIQPDVYVVCDRDKMRGNVLYGEPDLVIEVLSPSGEIRDRFLKYNKYKDAGVREYWMIDSKKREVTVCYFECQAEPEIYTFDDKVPVCIFGGELKIDFADIYQKISFLYERTTKS